MRWVLSVGVDVVREVSGDRVEVSVVGVGAVEVGVGDEGWMGASGVALDSVCSMWVSLGSVIVLGCAVYSWVNMSELLVSVCAYRANCSMPGSRVGMTSTGLSPTVSRSKESVSVAMLAGHCPCFHRIQKVVQAVAGSVLETGGRSGKQHPIEGSRDAFVVSWAKVVRKSVVRRG
jgi:hypothetical protein